MNRSLRCALVAGASLMLPAARPAIVFQFDYSYDNNNFFDTQAKRDVLVAAGQAISSRLGDTLDAITPGGGNTWSAAFFRPDTGATESIADLAVSANTLLIYAGGRSLTANVLGLGGAGGFTSAGGTASWFDTIQFRGEQANGATANPATSMDYGPWGGSITFSQAGSVDWNYTLAAPTMGQSDFYSVALHELSHLIGFTDTTESYARLVNTSLNTFTGSVTMGQNGGSAAPLNGQISVGDNSHFRPGLGSTLPFSTTSQETLMAPSLTTGSRREMTKLDFAVLDDIGWEVDGAVYQAAVPEPSEYLSVAGIGLLALAAWRRRNS